MNTPQNSARAEAGGLIVAAVTPWREDDVSIDIAASLELIDFLCASKADGIALLGSTGEFVHFSFEERTRLAALGVKRSRIPVLVNVTHSTLAGTLRLAEEATEAGAAGLLLMAPYYFRYSPGNLKEFFLRVAANSRLAPLYLYNIPFFTSLIPAEAAVELLAGGRFAGIKDSSGEWDYFLQLNALRQKSAFRLLLGNDRLYTRGLECAADGAISGVACALPEMMRALAAAVQENDAAKKSLLQARLEEFLEWLNRLPVPVGVKAAVEARGLKAGPLAAPLGAAGDETLEQYRGWLSEWIPRVLRESAGEIQADAAVNPEKNPKL